MKHFAPKVLIYAEKNSTDKLLDKLPQPKVLMRIKPVTVGII